MSLQAELDVSALVEEDRVHRTCYTDQEIFDREMQQIFHRLWIYVGHESQIKNPGDYATTIIGRQPMILSRGKDGQVHVLYNRCPHRGSKLCNKLAGNTGERFYCSYHGWQFDMDGRVNTIPMMDGYSGTRFDLDNPDFHMKRAARVESYRGFVFASLSPDGVDLKSHLGPSIAAFDDMCDRAPGGEVEIVPNCFRIIQKSNWKIFLENQLDCLHPSVTHASTGHAARAVEEAIEKRTTGKAPIKYHMLSAFAMPFPEWDKLETVGFPNGHCFLQGYMGLRPSDPDSLAYEKIMTETYGEDRKEEILSVNLHHALVYPCLSVQPPLQQLRAVRPLASNRTLTEIWHFRLKGAPEAIYRRSLDYYNLVNSPSTMVNADDLVNFRKCQEGLESDGGDWVSFHRNHGQDPVVDGVTTSVTGMSETPMRSMFAAWAGYMSGA